MIEKLSSLRCEFLMCSARRMNDKKNKPNWNKIRRPRAKTNQKNVLKFLIPVSALEWKNTSYLMKKTNRYTTNNQN